MRNDERPNGADEPDDSELAEDASPTFLILGEYGSVGAIESMSSVASPLLAGGAIALAGVVIQQADALLFPGITLTGLTIAAVTLILAVQFGFWARQFAVTPNEIAQWYPTMPADLR